MNWKIVKDRLPEGEGNTHIMCLVYDKYMGQILVRPYNEHYKCWDDEDCDDFYTDGVDGNITHWMELPEPPKLS